MKGRIESELGRHNQQSDVSISLSYGIHTASSKNAESAINFVDQQRYKQKKSKRTQSADSNFHELGLNEQDIAELSAHTDDIVLNEA